MRSEGDELMAALDEASRTHEEYRLRLAAEKDIRLAGLDVQRQVAEARQPQRREVASRPQLEAVIDRLDVKGRWNGRADRGIVRPEMDARHQLQPDGFRTFQQPVVNVDRVLVSRQEEPLLDDDLPARGPDVLDLITLRSNDQFNTTVYGYDDRFRGVKGTRDVLFMNRRDIARRFMDVDNQGTRS